jgi:hypothetical protein
MFFSLRVAKIPRLQYKGWGLFGVVVDIFCELADNRIDPYLWEIRLMDPRFVVGWKRQNWFWTIYDIDCRTIFQKTLEELSIRQHLSTEALWCTNRLSWRLHRHRHGWPSFRGSYRLSPGCMLSSFNLVIVVNTWTQFHYNTGCPRTGVD